MTDQIIILISAIFGTGGLGAMLQYLVQRRTATIDISKSRDIDERSFRRDLMKQLDNREQKHQEQLKNYDERIANVLAHVESLEIKYRTLANDYALLAERYIAQSAIIQSATSLTLERDHYKRQTETLQQRITQMEARIALLEAELGRSQ